MVANDSYVGRFAPSPTGPLHFGSLVAALASYLDARHHRGKWLLRIEDLDPPRESPSAPALIMEQLKGLGFTWDGEPLYQSERLDRYQACLDQLHAGGHLFLCTCSRKSFQQVYPGRCRGQLHTDIPAATRIQVTDEVLQFTDLIQGVQQFHLSEQIGDFILRRKDGLFAYQLAVVVDDHDQGVTHVLRGSDLLDSTPRQLYLARCLNFRSPEFGHFPVVVDEQGQKLSKQAHADPVTLDQPEQALKAALRFLQQPIPAEDRVANIMAAAIMNWSRERIPRRMDLPSPLV